MAMPLGPRARVRIDVLNEERESIELPLNPSELQVRGQAEWGTLGPLGLSHQIQQYARTQSLELSFQVQVLGLGIIEREGWQRGVARIHDVYRFLLGRLYPAAQGRAPDPVLLTWGNLGTLRGFVQTVDLRVTEFFRELTPRDYTADVRFVEEPLQFRSAAAMRAGGLSTAGVDRPGAPGDFSPQLGRSRIA